MPLLSTLGAATVTPAPKQDGKIVQFRLLGLLYFTLMTSVDSGKEAGCWVAELCSVMEEDVWFGNSP